MKEIKDNRMPSLNSRLFCLICNRTSATFSFTLFRTYNEKCYFSSTVHTLSLSLSWCKPPQCY